MILAIVLFEDSFLQIVSISFTALILTELLMVIFEVHQVNRWIVYAECISVSVYFISILLLPSYFDIAFMSTPTFWWKLIVLVSFSCIPVYLAKIIQRRVEPPSYQKLAT
jgi:phospholipid-translocating ATPase